MKIEKGVIDTINKMAEIANRDRERREKEKKNRKYLNEDKNQRIVRKAREYCKKNCVANGVKPNLEEPRFSTIKIKDANNEIEEPKEKDRNFYGVRYENCIFYSNGEICINTVKVKHTKNKISTNYEGVEFELRKMGYKELPEEITYEGEKAKSIELCKSILENKTIVNLYELV